MRWGIRSISIDREPDYLSMLAQRVREELLLPELALAAGWRRLTFDTAHLTRRATTEFVRH